jgi:hypothetical protein
MMLALRSLLFNIAFYVNLLVWVTVFLPAFVFPRKTFFWVPRGWARSSLWLLKWIAGTRLELRGVERIPPGGLLVAPSTSPLGDLRDAGPVRGPGLHHEARADVDPRFRLVRLEGDMIGSTARPDRRRSSR